MAFQRSIDLAHDKETSEHYDAAVCFKTAKEAYALRTRYNSGEIHPHCYRCEQPLIVSDSKNDHVHFKHFKYADFCPLKDGKMSDEDVEDFNTIICAREGERHILLKNRIAELLRSIDGVAADSVVADTRFFFSDIEKRRPDVYCAFTRVSKLPLKSSLLSCPRNIS